MFDQPSGAAPQGPAVEDIFSKTDPNSAKGPMPVASPASPLQPNPYPPTPTSPGAAHQDMFGGRAFPWRRLIITVLILIILGALAGLGWWGYQYGREFLQQPAPAPVATSTPAISEPATTTPDATNQNTDQVDTNDADADGLTATEERQYGTNPDRSDTDLDGLMDRAEIQIYQSDPLKADTDGDGYLDGDEVINGYDPVKTGNARLLQVPQ